MNILKLVTLQIVLRQAELDILLFEYFEPLILSAAHKMLNKVDYRSNAGEGIGAPELLPTIRSTCVQDIADKGTFCTNFFTLHF